MKSSGGRWIWTGIWGGSGGGMGGSSNRPGRVVIVAHLHTMRPGLRHTPSPQPVPPLRPKYCMLSATVTYTNISENAAVGQRRRL